MTAETCPTPEVGEALGPYIKPREEVAATRRRLQSYFESELQTNGSRLSPVTLPFPATAQSNSPPAGLSGVRKAYWKALQAHGIAQAKYDSLRAELDQLRDRKLEGNAGGDQASTSINEKYIPLLRQREKQRKLKAIEKAYSDISAAGNDLTTKSLDDVLNVQIGELPTAPSTRPSADENVEAEAQVLELKKALISTKRSIEERKKQLASYQATEVHSVSPEAHIAGLQAALQVLTSWMEGQLAIISNSEGDSQITESSVDNGTDSKRSEPVANAEKLYDRYLEARKRLIRAVNDPPQTQSEYNMEDLTGPSAGWKDTKIQTKTSAEILLPHIPSLIASKQQEQALLQQTGYIRRHLSAAEAKTEQSIHRLADESHLVQPGALRGEDWARAARESGEATDRFVDERVSTGEAFIESARRKLEQMRAMPDLVDRYIDQSAA